MQKICLLNCIYKEYPQHFYTLMLLRCLKNKGTFVCSLIFKGVWVQMYDI